jgi:hypothetical protein
MRSRSSLAIHLPKEEDELYHKTKVEAMMTAEEEFWRDNPDEYDKYLKYEREDDFRNQPIQYGIFATENIPQATMSNSRYNLVDAMKPLVLLLFIQYGVFAMIVWWNFTFMFV